MADEFTIKRVQNLIAQYVATRSRRYDFISTRAAHRALFEVVPLTGISDRALDDMIADRALAQGLSVCFDRETEAGPALPAHEPGCN